MIVLKSKREIEKMKEAGNILASVHKQLATMIKPGITTWQIDEFVERIFAKKRSNTRTKGL